MATGGKPRRNISPGRRGGGGVESQNGGKKKYKRTAAEKKVAIDNLMMRLRKGFSKPRSSKA